MIRFENVTKVYPRSTRPAVDGVTVSIERGEFVFVVGPSGSGKSTILRLALREEAPSEGTVLVAGHGEELAHEQRHDGPRHERGLGLAEPPALLALTGAHHRRCNGGGLRAASFVFVPIAAAAPRSHRATRHCAPVNSRRTASSQSRSPQRAR